MLPAVCSIPTHTHTYTHTQTVRQLVPAICSIATCSIATCCYLLGMMRLVVALVVALVIAGQQRLVRMHENRKRTTECAHQYSVGVEHVRL